MFFILCSTHCFVARICKDLITKFLNKFITYKLMTNYGYYDDKSGTGHGIGLRHSNLYIFEDEYVR